MCIYSATRNYYGSSFPPLEMSRFNIRYELFAHPYLPNPIMIIHSIGTANRKHRKRLFLSMQSNGATHIRRDFNVGR